jgi:hypothetical protein
MALMITALAQAAGDEKGVSRFSINASRAIRSMRARMGSARPCTGCLAAKPVPFPATTIRLR